MARAQLLSAIMLLFAAAAIAHGQVHPPAPPVAPGDRPNFSGDWTLNRELSDQPRIGTRGADGGDQPPTGGQRGEFGGYGGGRGGYGGHGGFGGGYGRRTAPRESMDERAKMLEVLDDVRSPSPTLTVSHSAA